VAKRKFTNRQLAFISHYIGDANWNGAKAARLAGFSEKTARSIAQRLLTNVDIQAEIRRRLNEKAMGADEVLTRLAEQARASIEGFLQFPKRGRKPALDLKQAQKDGLLHLVKKLRYNAQGQIEIELHDAQAALQLIGRHHGLFADDKVVTLKLEKELETVLNTLEKVLPNDDYQRVLAALAVTENLSGQPAGETETGDGQAGEENA
jgi:phage terminase small subunit